MTLNEETQAQSAGTPESDDDLWASTTLDDAAPPAEEPETVEVEAPEASIEDSYDGDDEEVEDEESFEIEHQEEPKHDYQKRYKDLEREFHKRNEESARLREEFQQIRLERLEMERELERMRQQPQKEAPAEPDPTDETSWFTDEDKQTLEDFSEITGVVKKLISHEIAKANKNLPLDQQINEIETLKKTIQGYEQQQAQIRQHNYLVETVGPDYAEVDKSSEFYDYVMNSSLRRKIMTDVVESTLEDKAEIMAEFLQTDIGRAKFRPPQEEQVERPASNKKEQRRKAASGLLKNTAPRSSKKIEDMDDDELWSSI